MRRRQSWPLLGLALLLLCLAVLAAWLQPAAWVWTPPGPQRWLLVGVAVLVYVAGCAAILRRGRQTQPVAGENALRVVHASQTGTAERIAHQSATALAQGGVPVACQPLAAIGGEELAQGGVCLFVVSTTGDGDAPDSAYGFQRDVMATEPDLSGLRYGLLALGDRTYAQYCGFGQAVEDWLQRCGAQTLFPRIDVDDEDEQALRNWQQSLTALVGASSTSIWVEAPYRPWRLRERERLNAGSPGGPVYRLSLMPPDAAALDWAAGDIAEVCIPVADNETAPQQREYSIASVPADGGLELIVRQVRHADGRLGAGSGWLTERARVGAEIQLRLRRNHGFHAPPLSAPMILIGNGTGLAGLRAHLRARAQAGAGRNWLLFGERSRRSDFLCQTELEGWQAQGLLQRLDLAFSRDGEPIRYVQDALRAATDELRRWISEGAYLYVCGSDQGMAPGVDAVLREAVGSAAVDDLRAQGRYRRDVY